MVQLVFACCPKGRSHIGWTGIVEGVEWFAESACYCGHKTRGLHAWVVIGGRGVVPLAWLIKVAPPGVTEVQSATEELTA